MRMRYNNSLLLILITSAMFTSSSDAAEQEVSAEFLQWYMKYSDENGEVFDPLALQELSAITGSENLPKNSEQQGSEKSVLKQKNQKSNEQIPVKKSKLAQDEASRESKALTQELSQP